MNLSEMFLLIKFYLSVMYKTQTFSNIVYYGMVITKA